MRKEQIFKQLTIILTAMTVVLVSTQRAASQTFTCSSRRALPAETPDKFEVAGADNICFQVALKANELFQVRLRQQDSEILMRLLDASGKEQARMSSPREKDGLETLTFVAAEPAVYVFVVGLLDPNAPPGKFTIASQPLRQASAADRRRLAAEKSFAEGMSARDAAGQAETAVKKFSEAERGYQELGDDYMFQVSHLMVIRSRARATFIEARKLLELPQSERNPTTFQSALTGFQQAGRLYHEGGEANNEGASRLGAALAAESLGDLDSTIEFVEQTLPIYSGDKAVRAALLDNLATFDLVRNDIDSSINRLREARSLYIDLQSPEDEARAENALGNLYLQIGKYPQAKEVLESSLKLRTKNPTKCGLASTESNLGQYYYYVKEKALAQEFLLTRALQHYPSGEDCAGERGQTQIIIGNLYYDLGATDLARQYLSEARISLQQEPEKPEPANPFDRFEYRVNTIEHRRNIATALNYLGATDFASAKNLEASIPLTKANSEKAEVIRANVKRLYQSARNSYREALQLYQSIGDRKHEATVMTNLGVVDAASGATDGAFRIFAEALKVSEDADDLDGQGITLDNIGAAHSQRRDDRQALEYLNRALPLLAAAGDKSGEAVALSDAMNAWANTGNRRMAIFCGKRAVDIFQELRNTARGLDTEIQKDYLRSIGSSYRRLAELLIEERRSAEAAHILNLYQDQQFYDLDSKALVDRTEPLPREIARGEDYESTGQHLRNISERFDEVKRRRVAANFTADQKKAQLNELKALIRNTAIEFGNALKRAENEFAQPARPEDTADPKSDDKIQTAVARLADEIPQSKVVALYTLIGARTIYVLAVTPKIRVFSSSRSREDVQQLIIKFLSDLQNPVFPDKVRDSGSSLYDMIFGAVSTEDGKTTLAAELKHDQVATLLWSLDGMLSYLPMGALFDSSTREYVIQRYQNVVFTRADPNRILHHAPRWTTAVGFGKSTPTQVTCPAPCDSPPCNEQLSALPLVPREIESIFHRAPKDRVVLKRVVVLNERFTLAQLRQANHKSLVHIASHFCFQPGDSTKSFLLLGDNSKLSLEELKRYADLYAGVDLLVLSACQTAALQPSQTGKEVDSLAELAQRQHAASVIATLWNADNIGASRLMIKFYALYKQQPDLSKAELLRRAQLGMLNRTEVAPNMNLDHPYYWAPFVLYGSFR